MRGPHTIATLYGAALPAEPGSLIISYFTEMLTPVLTMPG